MPKPASSDPRMFTRRLALGRRVRELREERGLSQSELASQAGLERKAVQRVETAAVVPSLERLLEIADALDVPAAELFTTDPGPKRRRRPKNRAAEEPARAG